MNTERKERGRRMVDTRNVYNKMKQLIPNSTSYSWAVGNENSAYFLK